MNDYPGITWEFNAPTNKVDFMDLTISITNGQISTSLFEKELNLHLYIPPHSAHPPGLLPGIVHSTLFRIFALCSDHNNRILSTKVFATDYKHEATGATILNPYFSKPSPVHNVTLELLTRRQMIKLGCSFTSHPTQMTRPCTKSNKHGATQSHH